MSLFLVLPNWHISSKACHEVLGKLRRLDGVFQGHYLPIDLLTDTAAILNLLVFRSIMMVCPGGTRLVFTSVFRSKRELHCIFLGKKAIIITSKHSTTIFFSHYNLFIGKLKEKLVRKARLITERVYRIQLMPEAKTSQVTFDVCLIGQGGQN